MFNNLLEIIAGPSQLSRNQIYTIKDILSKLYAESNSRMIGITFDITEALIRNYSETVIESKWLFILFKNIIRMTTKDVCKQNAIQNKMNATLLAVHEMISLSQQFDVISRFFTDRTQVMDSKFNFSLVRYFTNIVDVLEKHHYDQQVMLKTLRRLFDLAIEDRSLETKNACEICLIKCFKANNGANLVFQQLPMGYQQPMSNLLKKYENYPNISSYKTNPLLAAKNSNHNTQIIMPKKSDSHTILLNGTNNLSLPHVSANGINANGSLSATSLSALSPNQKNRLTNVRSISPNNSRLSSDSASISEIATEIQNLNLNNNAKGSDVISTISSGRSTNSGVQGLQMMGSSSQSSNVKLGWGFDFFCLVKNL